MTEVPFEEDDAPERDLAALTEARIALEARCKGTRITVTDEELAVGEHFLIVSFPAGRETRQKVYGSASAVNELLAVPFEQYVFLGPYEAIACYTSGTIECGIRTLQHHPRALFRAIQGKDIPSDLREVQPIELPRSPSGISVAMGPPSPAFDALATARPYPVTIRITGVTISQHDQALDILERLAFSVFFQIDLLTAIPLSLVRRRVRLPVRRRTTKEEIELKFPDAEYDKAPLSLYWYGRGAIGMPLLQFLAFYQVTEFYFPVYSQAEAQRRVQQILKDPSFRADRQADINRVLNVVKASAAGAYGDERSQLRATVNECVDPHELRAFLSADDERKKFLASKTKGLTSHRLPIDNPNVDLRNDVADRIYDIRCKIVHTKSGGREGDVELLLPFSAEAEMLYHDIEVLSFVALKVLIAASSPLRALS